MMVTFVSQCEKKALSRTRRVLDAFANRIGDNTWQTIITEDGLIAVKQLLRKTVTKNSAISCHWIRSRSRSELVWIVGNRNKFSKEGFVPVNSTKKSILNNEWENNWTYLPLIKALVAVAALLHDWGKATLLFQQKLKVSSKEGDPLRHEWISCLLLNALIEQSGDNKDDTAWLSLLSSNTWNEAQLQAFTSQNIAKPLDNLPPLAQWVAWLIVTHHRMPSLRDKTKRDLYQDAKRDSINAMLKSINAEWGYQNISQDKNYQQRLKNCFNFPQGLLSQSTEWLKHVKKWSGRLLQEQHQAKILAENGAWRVVLHHSRLCLMLGDHYYSSCEKDKNWKSSIELYANTERNQSKQTVLKQKLDEHLVKVSQQALQVSQSLSRFSTDMDFALDIKALKQKSPSGFEWQDKAVDSIKTFKQQHKEANDNGWFIVNMASTGYGKTIANAKIMRALSNDGESLRYILALGLRTLTLQTGDEYKHKIGLDSSELAVLIGSAAVKELHEKAQNNLNTEPTCQELGSESAELLLDEELDFSEAPTADFLSAVLPANQPKNHAFLYKPVLACTIDHIIAATETTRGGKYILPCLRLLSSDLVIDEVDDFDGQDLIAIGRLIHLAGMLGRKVMISSATIPPSLAEGFFNAYQEGWKLHSAFKQQTQPIACVWVDEFKSQIETITATDSKERTTHYQKTHQVFISKRIEQLKQQTIKRKGYIVDCEALYQQSTNDAQSTEQQYFSLIQQQIIKLHQQHHTIDKKTGKKVSFGVVRIANIPPCIALSQYLLNADWDNTISPKIMAYHSRQVLLLRSEQEHHLEEVLKRKEKTGETPQAFNNAIVRQHLNHTNTDNVIFILVATPVEEVGRDHDFDWAVIEPSSYRSIIQLAGRVRRHRKEAINTPNIAIMQYNLKGLRHNNKASYCRPGFENEKSLRLSSHDLKKLLDEKGLQHAINAIPRIQEATPLRYQEQLADLEHKAISSSIKNYNAKGAQSLQAWLSEYWWMTALPQQFNRFRASSPDIQLFLAWQNNKTVFGIKDEKGHFIPREGDIFKVKPFVISPQAESRLWLKRDYYDSLCRLVENGEPNNLDTEQNLRYNSLRYGEITIAERDKEKEFVYSDQFGLTPKTQN
jgi:CRISPR-associated endonuclease/helicase Cas3